MKLVIFEDERWDGLLPLVRLRAVFELRCGALTLGERIEGAAGHRADALFVREHLAGVVAARTQAAVNDGSALEGDGVLFVNGRVLALGLELPLEGPEEAVWDGEVLQYGRADAKRMAHYGVLAHAGDLRSLGKQLPHVERALSCVERPWDLIVQNPAALGEDFERAGRWGVEGTMAAQSCVHGPEGRVWVAPGAEVHPLVCIDTHGGPVTIESGAEVQPLTRIEGPCWVGPNSVLLGAKVRGGCSIGPDCRVGGELEESILHAHVNKYHEGFVGHSYLCEWVNLGAGTTTSDLKNDYTPVTVRMRGAVEDTGLLKVGAFLGDHVKTGIGTLLNTGTVLGVMSMVLPGPGLGPRRVPAFTWWARGRLTRGFGPEAMVATARTVLDRRKERLTAAAESALRRAYEETASERDAAIHASAGHEGGQG